MTEEHEEKDREEEEEKAKAPDRPKVRVRPSPFRSYEEYREFKHDEYWTNGDRYDRGE